MKIIKKQEPQEEPEEKKPKVQTVEPEDSGGVQLKALTQSFQVKENVSIQADQLLYISLWLKVGAAMKFWISVFV